MTAAERQKLKLTSIFDRRGSSGKFTQKFADLPQDEQRDLLGQVRLNIDELPVVASRRSSHSWILITTSRIISSDSGYQTVIRHADIQEVVPPEICHVTEKEERDELTLQYGNGLSRILTLEPGPPFTGVWSVLLNIAHSNRRSA
jgi:hypothetical protein